MVDNRLADDGLITQQSAYAVAETIERLAAAVMKRGMTVFAKIDHAEGAAKVNLPLRPTILILFGHAKGGTALMQDRQTAGIDLPLKALAWEDADGKTWLSYNDPVWIARRHGLGAASVSAVEAMAAAMKAIVKEGAG